MWRIRGMADKHPKIKKYTILVGIVFCTAYYNLLEPELSMIQDSMQVYTCVNLDGTRAWYLVDPNNFLHYKRINHLTNKYHGYYDLQQDNNVMWFIGYTKEYSDLVRNSEVFFHNNNKRAMSFKINKKNIVLAIPPKIYLIDMFSKKQECIYDKMNRLSSIQIIKGKVVIQNIDNEIGEVDEHGFNKIIKLPALGEYMEFVSFLPEENKIIIYSSDLVAWNYKKNKVTKCDIGKYSADVLSVSDDGNFIVLRGKTKYYLPFIYDVKKDKCKDLPYEATINGKLLYGGSFTNIKFDEAEGKMEKVEYPGGSPRGHLRKMGKAAYDIAYALVEYFYQ